MRAAARDKSMIGCLLMSLAAITVGGPSASAVELTARQREALLDEARRAFDRGAEIRQSDPRGAVVAFREAAEKFQIIVDSGVRNGRLYYNLANAYLESGRLGLAIANYRRAQQRMPADGRIAHNLEYARSLRQDQIEVVGQEAFLKTLFFWHYATSPRLRLNLAGAFYLIFWLLLIVRTVVRRRRWWYMLLPVAVVGLVLGCSVLVGIHQQQSTTEGVLTADDVIVRKGNGEGFEPQFKQALHEGVEFRILERRDDWLLIQLPDAKTGWIRAAQAEII